MAKPNKPKRVRVITSISQESAQILEDLTERAWGAPKATITRVALARGLALMAEETTAALLVQPRAEDIEEDNLDV